VRLPDNKTSYVEQGADGGRGIQLDKYRVGGRVIRRALARART
jgi:hypothetical protein